MGLGVCASATLVVPLSTTLTAIELFYTVVGTLLNISFIILSWLFTWFLPKFTDLLLATCIASTATFNAVLQLFQSLIAMMSKFLIETALPLTINCVTYTLHSGKALLTAACYNTYSLLLNGYRLTLVVMSACFNAMSSTCALLISGVMKLFSFVTQWTAFIWSSLSSTTIHVIDIALSSFVSEETKQEIISKVCEPLHNFSTISYTSFALHVTLLLLISVGLSTLYCYFFYRHCQQSHTNSKLCVVCIDKEKQVLLRPCRHYCLCNKCSERVGRCPVCRALIREKEYIHIYD